MGKKIAIIGAGISGLTIAQNLQNHAEVTIFEKSRGVGGRMSTRFIDPFYFDHGAQCFTARTKEFKEFIHEYKEKGTIEEWSGSVITIPKDKNLEPRIWTERHLVSSPNMNSLCKILAIGKNIKLNTEVAPLSEKEGGKRRLTSSSSEDLGLFDIVISTAPPVQTSRLFEGMIEHDHPLLVQKMQVCFALMVGLEGIWQREWIAAKIHSNPIKWVSVNSSKPSRNRGLTSLVAHSRSNWSQKNKDTQLKEVKQIMMEELAKITAINLDQPQVSEIHRWLYAIVSSSKKTGPYFDEINKIGATSDWCYTSRIEEVWISANTLTKKIMDSL
ncbi:MAG: FAD-dependent oxidoreductase [Rickettsiaceae bacterium]|nr:FAD-dependent oxidoreductase [Rickettsiaceae bacterium]